MKAPSFDYARPATLTEALALLRRHAGDAKLLAGGQSLLPALNLRLMAPALLIDIGGLADLRGVTVAGGVLRIGALSRHAELLRSPGIAAHAPLVARALAHVAHPAIRNRGTIGGSLAHADPAAELPACALALRVRLVLEREGGRRVVQADDFFTGLFATALEPDEMLTAIEIDLPAAGARDAFLELARRNGDYAMVGLAAHGVFDRERATALRIAYFAVGARATLAERAVAALCGAASAGAGLAAAEAALADDLSPHDDLQASAATRLALARVLLRRAVGELAPARQAA